MANQQDDNTGRDTIIRTLVDKSFHHDHCLQNIYEHLERINENLEILARDHPELNLITLTNANYMDRRLPSNRKK